MARLEDELRAAETVHHRMHEVATAYGQVLRTGRAEYTGEGLGAVHDAWLDGLSAALDALPTGSRPLLTTPEQESP